MAEPTNTPIPASTPRSASPLHFHHGAGNLDDPSMPLSPNRLAALSLHQKPQGSLHSASSKPRILHIGDPVRYNPDVFLSFVSQFEVVRPSAEERQREEFIKALKEGRWGSFAGILRPHWGRGGEMGKWDAELIGLLPPEVKVFASAGAGFDWADTELLGHKGIIYCNSGLAAAEAVADFGVAMIISTFRHLPWCISAAAEPSRFSHCHQNATGESRLLRDHALGLIGFGNIGQQLARRCHHGFGMRIHFFDVERKSAEIAANVNATAHDTLESLLGAADCVVLCTPATEGTLINASTLPQFRPGARFVNVARGSLVDENALCQALQEGHISAAALDVHANEPNVHAGLAKMAREEGRVMLTCHNAGGTLETHQGFEELSMRNVMAVLGGEKPLTPVNLQYLARKD
ncbi:d-isomer specific 2-hydroxyacid dehydrogenase, NAD binding domain-containing protein [Sarocladium implicatum]|nr:d-isomer specific 2-hydroxyacid dehydrogenase, NAD binding domain-containing protein [Sarocladium implicatum]